MDRRLNTKKAIKKWVEKLCEVTGKKPTPLATGADLHPQTLLRAIDLDDPNLLSTDSIDKLVQRYNVPPPNLEGLGNGGPSGFHEDEITPIEQPTDPSLSGQIEHFEINTRIMDGAGMIPGDMVTVEMGAKAKPGDIVYAQVYDKQGGAETVLRRYDPPYLLTETTDPTLRRKPVLFEVEDVRIAGVVIRREWVRQAS